jgi:hypothetical protein
MVMRLPLPDIAATRQAVPASIRRSGREAVKADYNFDVTGPEIALSARNPALLLRFQTVDQPPTGPRESGKYIHLSMTLNQAMYLLAQLQAVQRHTGAPVPSVQETPLQVPPAKERN